MKLEIRRGNPTKAEVHLAGAGLLQDWELRSFPNSAEVEASSERLLPLSHRALCHPQDFPSTFPLGRVSVLLSSSLSLSWLKPSSPGSLARASPTGPPRVIS